MTHELKKFKTTEELAEWYDQKYTEMGKGWDCPESEANKYLDFAEVPHDREKFLLDVGCGFGDFLKEAVKRCTCIGVDISSIAINSINASDLPATVFVAEIENFKPIGWKLDYVTSIGSIEHCVNIPKALKSIYKLLKDDGKFYALVPNELWIHMDQPNEVTHTDEEWSKLFEKHKFKIVKQERIGDITHFLMTK